MVSQGKEQRRNERRKEEREEEKKMPSLAYKLLALCLLWATNSVSLLARVFVFFYMGPQGVGELEPVVKMRR